MRRPQELGVNRGYIWKVMEGTYQIGSGVEERENSEMSSLFHLTYPSATFKRAHIL
jgi:hypothetical protein